MLVTLELVDPHKAFIMWWRLGIWSSLSVELMVVDDKDEGLVNKVTKMEEMVVNDKEEMFVNKVTKISSKLKL